MNLQKLLKTTPSHIAKLALGGIHTAEDLLRYFPRTYEDRVQIKRLNEVLVDGSVQTVKGMITKKSLIRTPGGKRLCELTFVDEGGDTGYVQVLNNTFILREVKLKQRYLIIGKPQFQGSKINFRHPEVLSSEEFEKDSVFVGRIYPIYSEMNGIKPARFAKKLFDLLPQLLPRIQDALPKAFLDAYGFPDLHTTLRNIHFPSSLEDAQHGKMRIFFERLLHVQLLSLMNKASYEVELTPVEPPHREIVKELVESLPFQLTGAQKRVIKEIIDDFHGPKTMMRLLQGDVGSGKTIVAAIAAVYCHKVFGGQVAFLAPLEVLAQQHHRSLAKLLLPLGIRVELLTGSLTDKHKNEIKDGLAQGTIDVIVGTHAILQESIRFKKLSFAVIDEQHKFGVRQRAALQNHGSPHLLQMTATPIPRSLALAYFGEFEVSSIDEMPAGRKPIITKIMTNAERKKLKPWVMTKILQGQKVFIITPLIEESEKLDEVRSAFVEFEEISELYSELDGKIGLLHGRMKSKDKDETMQKFKNGGYSILVSTTVIEVGIDIPDATVMIVKNAERFGLSQLHQLRGRVGRSDLQSYCFLQMKSRSGDSFTRLRNMEETTDGFKLAEIDLQLRGSGEILGIRQSGETDIPLEIIMDVSFLKRVQEAAQRLLQTYPNLETLDLLNAELQKKMDGTLV